eukprot:746638-Hanusia_phi.AAC.8
MAPERLHVKTVGALEELETWILSRGQVDAGPADNCEERRARSRARQERRRQEELRTGRSVHQQEEEDRGRDRTRD